MAGAAYWRSRTLFGNQVTVQMQNQLSDQLSQLDLSIKTKQIRLDNFVRQSEFDNELDSALSEDPQNVNFAALQR